MLGVRNLKRHVEEFGKAVKNTGNTAIGINKGERTAIAKHDVLHGTNFWEHISNNKFNEAKNSLNKMKNPALKASGQRLHTGLKLVKDKVPGGENITSLIGGTYLRAGHILGKAVGAKDMTEELKKYENARTNESNRGPQEKHDIQIEQEAHFKNATEKTITGLNELLKNPALNEETKNTINKALEIIMDEPPRYENLTGGSSCSGKKHRKSKKHGKSKNGKNGKKGTRKHRGGTKKTRKTRRRTKRKTKRNC